MWGRGHPCFLFQLRAGLECLDMTTPQTHQKFLEINRSHTPKMFMTFFFWKNFQIFSIYLFQDFHFCGLYNEEKVSIRQDPGHH